MGRTKGHTRSRTTSSLARSVFLARRLASGIPATTSRSVLASRPRGLPSRVPTWTGKVNIRGKLITGVIKTTKMKNTVIIRKDYLHYIKKYNRFEKRHKNTPVHVSPAFRVKQGDEILAGQCRPLSKTVRFNMLKVLRAAGGDKKGFTGA